MKKKVAFILMMVLFVGHLNVAFSMSDSISNPRRKEALDKQRSKRLSQCKQKKISKRALRAMKSKRRLLSAYQ